MAEASTSSSSSKTVASSSQRSKIDLDSAEASTSPSSSQTVASSSGCSKVNIFMSQTGASSSRRSHREISSGVQHTPHQQKHTLNLFDGWLACDIGLPVLELIVNARVLLFRSLEKLNNRGYKPFTKQWFDELRSEITEMGRRIKCTAVDNILLLIDDRIKSADRAKAIEDEEHGHFICRIIYSRNEELKEYFIARELEWFQTKWVLLDPQEISNFLENSDFKEKPIEMAEKMSLKSELMDSTTGGITEQKFNTTDFYKIRFQEVLPLINKREVFLRSGKGYVPTHMLFPVFQCKLRKTLEKSLTSIYETVLKEGYIPDSRIAHMCAELDPALTGHATWAANQGDLQGEKLDATAEAHFPLCMKHFHERLREDHHLKHQGRYTYGLFLKSIGLGYEAAEAMWREEFTKNMDEETYIKKYLYHIKHLYGMVGGRLNRDARSCARMIEGLDQHYGCPFKMYSKQMLFDRCIKEGFEKKDADEVVELADGCNYQMACAKYFQVTNDGRELEEGVYNPVQYYNESCLEPCIEDIF